MATQTKTIVLYTKKENCPDCEVAKRFLADHDIGCRRCRSSPSKRIAITRLLRASSAVLPICLYDERTWRQAGELLDVATSPARKTKPE